MCCVPFFSSCLSVSETVPVFQRGKISTDEWQMKRRGAFWRIRKKMCSIISSTVSTLERLAIPICLIQIIHLMVWFTRLDLPLWSHWMNSAVGPSNCLGNLSHILLWYKRFRTYEFGNRQNYIELINQTFLQTGIHTPPKSKRCGCAI